MNTSKGLILTASILGVLLVVVILLALLLGMSGSSQNTNNYYMSSSYGQNQREIPYASSFVQYHTARDTKPYTNIQTNPAVPVTSVHIIPNVIHGPTPRTSVPIQPGATQGPTPPQPKPRHDIPITVICD
jgi:hypothetical protein